MVVSTAIVDRPPVNSTNAFMVVLAMLASTLVSVTVGASPAFAAPANVQMPFSCGETWHASTYTGHGPSEYSVDWNLIGSEDHNKPVVAGVSGNATVHYQASGYGNYVDVDAGGSWVYRYAHLQTVSVADNTAVTSQTLIGTIGASGLTGTPPPYHLHYEQRYNGVVQPATFNGSGITYVYSYNTSNPYTSANCGNSSGTQMILADGAVQAKDIFGYGGWTSETNTSTVTAIAASSTLQMALVSNGEVWTRNSIAPGPGGWTQEAGPGTAVKIAVGGNTRMILTSNGTVFAKNTSGSGGWNQETNANVGADIAVSSTGVQMVLVTNGEVWAKNDAAGSMGGWTGEVNANTAVKIAVGGNTQMVLVNNGEVWARGSVGGPTGWTGETNANTASGIAVSSTGVQMVLVTNGEVWARGSVGAGPGGWTGIAAAGTATKIAAGGNTQMLIRGDSSVWAKSSSTSAWDQETAAGTATAIAAGG